MIWKIGLLASIAFVLLSACARSGGSEEVGEYAVAMEGWWLEVAGGDFPSVLAPSLSVDRDRVFDSAFGREKPLPEADPPSSIAEVHRLIETTLFAMARAEGEVVRQGIYAGIAAGFCNPSRTAFGFSIVSINAEALQSWRGTGDGCRGGRRWAGNLGDDLERSADVFRDYQWSCGSDRSDLEDYRVFTSDLSNACRNLDSWRQSFNAAVKVWSRDLSRLCGNDLSFIPSVEQALDACR